MCTSFVCTLLWSIVGAFVQYCALTRFLVRFPNCIVYYQSRGWGDPDYEVSGRASHGNHHAESILFCFFILHFSIFLFFIVILCILFVQLYKCIVLLSVQVSGLCPRRKGGILMWGIFLDWLLFVYTNNLPQNTDIGWKNVMSFCAHRKVVFALLFGSFIFCFVMAMDVRW